MAHQDKRTVSTDALETLGMIHTREEKRDAIHLAVIPAEAGETLDPGEHGIVENGIAFGTDVGHGLGIVDPFLTRRVKKGEKFWFVIYPRTIQSLRHVWVHPAFPDELPSEAVTQESTDEFDQVAKAEEWIQAHADELGISYNNLMEYAKNWINYGDCHVERGGQYLQDNFLATEFWQNYEIVTGREVDKDKKHSFFSCSC